MSEYTLGELVREKRRRLHEEFSGPDADHAHAAEFALRGDVYDANGRHVFESPMLAHAILALVYELRNHRG